MAVKHKVVENREQDSGERLYTILRTLQSIHANTENQWSTGDRIKMCETIVQRLGTIDIPKSAEHFPSFMDNVKKIQDILTQACSSQNLILVTLKALYTEISDKDKDPSPTMSIVLQLIEPKLMPFAVRGILQGPHSEQELEQALMTLCKWLSKWTCTPNLGPLVLYFMEGLEKEQHYEILVEVTLKYIEKLFRLIVLHPNRKFVAPVVFRMLRSMQHSPDAFHKIIPHVKRVLACLNKENTESSRACEEEIATLCIILTKHFPGYAIYSELKDVLTQYGPLIKSRQMLNCKSWQDVNLTYSVICNVGKVGLNNLGNTCYMNSILQALFMTKQFRKDVLVSTKDAMPLLAKLQTLFALLQFSKRPSLAPTEILNIARPPGFQPGHQHDSSEFLGYLLDVLHEQERVLLHTGHVGDGETASDTEQSGSQFEADKENQIPQKRRKNQTLDCEFRRRKIRKTSGNELSPQISTVVQKSFGGRGVTESRCGTCGHQSERADNFRELQLSFPSNTDNESVQTLLNYYLQPEKLCGENQYHCDKCQCLTDGERVTRVVAPPTRLVLTLKQFRYDPSLQLRTKILQRVKLNDIIQLEQAQYELYASVVHNGSSVDSGHYYTFARDTEDWYKFNDCSVMKTQAEELHSLKPPETPYILFYRMVEFSEPEAVSQDILSERIQTVLSRDETDFQNEWRRRQRTLPTTTTTQIVRKDDDDPPPPPGFGGFSNATTRYVC